MAEAGAVAAGRAVTRSVPIGLMKDDLLVPTVLPSRRTEHCNFSAALLLASVLQDARSPASRFRGPAH